MFSDVSNAPIYNDTGCPEMRGPGRHQAAPASRVQPFRLLNVHDLAVLVEIDKVLGRLGSRLVTHLNHLDSEGWAHDARGAASHLGRPHADAIEEAAIRNFKLDECVANLSAHV